ncbi:putative efflux pump mfs2 [Fusarium oxysporum f. sp. cubense]|uniref:Putative efflux pump mfs2 n=1 Tax=Fusarium oxysporum f. sp. cubense TaxID=61366 RepID=A0A559KKX6_FUSOC|nr:putative efflux pump mfs2 [Fusarium oxysporum f. sp. cubense]
MVPAPIDPSIKDVAQPIKDTLKIPDPAKQRLEKSGIDLSKGYPYRPSRPLYLDDVYKIRDKPRDHIDAGARADKSKKSLLSAATKVTDLTAYIGTEIEGLQLKDLTNQQRDELALLIAERSVVFFRDQDLSPQQQKELGEWYGEVEVHPQVPHVPGVPGVSVLWPDLMATERPASFRQPGGASRWHTDLVHEKQPAGITHLHNDTIPSVGGDTLWASGYAAYEKLSPEFRKIIDGREAVYRSAHPYLDRDYPEQGPKYIERVHPIVRVHPATGWKALWVNRAMTDRIVGLDRAESDVILNYLYDVYEQNVDIQVRFKWTPRTSALWDNRITIHNASWDYSGREPRHGTRVTSLAEKPYFDASAPTRREALGLLGDSEKKELEALNNVSSIEHAIYAILEMTADVKEPVLDTELGVLNSTPPDPYLVAFNELDSDNPKNWPEKRKWAVTNVLSITGFNRILVSTVMAPALSVIAKDLNMTATQSVMALSIYLLATAFGPLVIGPLSEVYGRRTILHVSNIWFLVWNLACGFANSKEMLIGTRFLAGFGASAVYALGGGVLGDIWRPDQRGKSLGWYSVIPLIGAATGPVIGGFMTDRISWRWMFWSTSMFQVAMAAISFTTFRETYAPAILKKRAKKLRKETGQPYYTYAERTQEGHTLRKVLTQAMTRPLRLLAFHPIIQVAAVISAIGYGLLYIVLSSFAEVWAQHYGQSVEISGLHYISCALGELAGSQLGAPLMDYWFRRTERRNGQHLPENRVPLMAMGAFIAPIGFIVYGWCAEFRVHWAWVDVAMFITMFGMQISGMPLQAYLIDAYPDHTSSAIAAQQFPRSLAAFLFPLFTPKMYAALGYGWGNSAMAFAELALELAAPLLLWKVGASLRARATSSL